MAYLSLSCHVDIGLTLGAGLSPGAGAAAAAPPAPRGAVPPLRSAWPGRWPSATAAKVQGPTGTQVISPTASTGLSHHGTTTGPLAVGTVLNGRYRTGAGCLLPRRRVSRTPRPLRPLAHGPGHRGRGHDGCYLAGTACMRTDSRLHGNQVTRGVRQGPKGKPLGLCSRWPLDDSSRRQHNVRTHPPSRRVQRRGGRHRRTQ
jgi:hypothetical protein